MAHALQVQAYTAGAATVVGMGVGRVPDDGELVALGQRRGVDGHDDGLAWVTLAFVVRHIAVG